MIGYLPFEVWDLLKSTIWDVLLEAVFALKCKHFLLLGYSAEYVAAFS